MDVLNQSALSDKEKIEIIASFVYQTRLSLNCKKQIEKETTGRVKSTHSNIIKKLKLRHACDYQRPRVHIGSGYIFNTCLCNFQRPIGRLLTMNKQYDKGRPLTTNCFHDEPNKLVETMELIDGLKMDHQAWQREEQEKKIKSKGKK